MAYWFRRFFEGVEGHYSVEEEGPEALKRDIDEMAMMFRPDGLHDDGSKGGIYAEYMAEDFWDGWNGTTPSEELASKIIDGLNNPNDPASPAATIWQQIKGVWDALVSHVSKTVVGVVHGFQIDDGTGMALYMASDGTWKNITAAAVGGHSPPLINHLDQELSGVGALDAVQGKVLSERVASLEHAEDSWFKYTLHPLQWINGIYTIIDATPASNSKIRKYDRIEVALDEPTAEQILAFDRAACVDGGGQVDGAFRLMAMGSAPMIAIPIVCYVDHKRASNT